jgi:hypothetical protein
MEALAGVGGPDVCCLAAAAVRDRTEPVALRAAAACTLGMLRVADHDTMERLTGALGDDTPGVAVGAARGLAMCAPRRARLALEARLGDRRSIKDKTVGELILAEIDQLDRQRARQAHLRQ